MPHKLPEYFIVLAFVPVLGAAIFPFMIRFLHWPSYSPYIAFGAYIIIFLIMAWIADKRSK